jgi:hypothetical protein
MIFCYLLSSRNEQRKQAGALKFRRVVAWCQSDAFASLRGYKPVIDPVRRKLVRTIEPAKGAPNGDVHGTGVCILGR